MRQAAEEEREEASSAEDYAADESPPNAKPRSRRLWLYFLGAAAIGGGVGTAVLVAMRNAVTPRDLCQSLVEEVTCKACIVDRCQAWAPGDLTKGVRAGCTFYLRGKEIGRAVQFTDVGEYDAARDRCTADGAPCGESAFWHNGTQTLLMFDRGIGDGSDYKVVLGHMSGAKRGRVSGIRLPE